MDGSGAEREILQQGPVLLRDQFVAALRAVRMGVDQAGDDGLAGDIHCCGASGDIDLTLRTDRKDAVTLDDDHAIVDDPAILACHGDDPRAGERDRTGRLVRRNHPFERDAGGGWLIFGGILCDRRIGEQHVCPRRIEIRPEAPVQLFAALRPVDIVGAAGADPGDRQRLAGRADLDRLRARHQRHDIGFVALAKGQIPPVGRHDIVIGEFALGMGALRFAIEIGADQDALVLVAVEHEDPVAGGTELRSGAALLDAYRRAARCGHAVDAIFRRPLRGGQIAAFLHLEDNHLAVGRELRAGIMAGPVGDGARSWS